MAQLGEQQVQGCTTRITHLEAVLTRQLDSLRQQHNTQAASLADLTAHMHSQLTSTAHDSSHDITDRPDLTQLQAQLQQLQTDLARSTADSTSAELASDMDALKAQVGQLQEAPSTASDVASLQEHVAALTNDVAQLQEQSAADSIAKLEQDVGQLKSGLSQLHNSQADQQATAALVTQLQGARCAGQPATSTGSSGNSKRAQHDYVKAGS